MLWKLIIFLLFSSSIFSSCLEPRQHGEIQRASAEATHSGYRTVAYYVNWAIYDRQFFPRQLPADKLTHVLYAFANINPDSGEIYLSDLHADTRMHFEGDALDDTGSNLYGCLKQLYLLKKQNRNLKILLSVGGWTYSSNFARPASTSLGRSKFATSAVSLIRHLGLDGLDIDWEYPTDDTQAGDFVLLLQAVRCALDAYSNSLSTPYHFTLTVAGSAGPSNYKLLPLAKMDQYVDFWNLMAYDYAGSWSDKTGHQANLFFADNATTPFDTQTAVSYYISQGITANKIVLGMPLYGRAFDNSKGLGMPFHGAGNGTWEAGVYDFKALPLAGAIELFDNKSGASYSYDSSSEELISYDTIEAAKRKAAYIRQVGLGGGMWWESSADSVGGTSLIKSVAGLLGGEDGSGLESSLNELVYLNTTYTNLRAGMPEDGNSATTAAATSRTCLCTSLQTTGLLDSSPLSRTVNTSLDYLSISTPATSLATQSACTSSRKITSSEPPGQTLTAGGILTLPDTAIPLPLGVTTFIDGGTITISNVEMPLPSGLTLTDGKTLTVTSYKTSPCSSATCSSFNNGEYICSLAANNKATCLRPGCSELGCSNDSDCGAGKDCYIKNCCRTRS